MQSSFNLIFDPSEDAAIHWAARTGLEHGLDLRTVEQLYARALPYIKNWAWALTTKHGWTEDAVDSVGDMPLAVCLGRDELVQGVNGDQTYVARLVLPANFSDFLNPEFANDWAAMFSHLTTCFPQFDSESSSPSPNTDIFQLGRAGLPRPLQNILYLLQILSPGLLLVRSMTTTDVEEDDEDGEWGPQDIDDLIALPPSIWVGLHIEDLEDIFGAQTAIKLYQTAEDPYCVSEEASSYGSYGSQVASEHFSDSSYSAFSSDMSEEEWPGFDDELPEFEEDDNVYIEHSVPYAPANEDTPLDLSTATGGRHQPQHQHTEYSKFPDYNLISDPNVGKAENIMEYEYRHCDSDCAFCGMCSSRFAARLTERLLMHVL